MQIEKHLNEHKGSIPWMAVTEDGKFFISASYTETIIWDVKTLQSIVIIEESLVVAFSKHR
jgi:hypothetical protein